MTKNKQISGFLVGVIGRDWAWLGPQNTPRKDLGGGGRDSRVIPAWMSVIHRDWTLLGGGISNHIETTSKLWSPPQTWYCFIATPPILVWKIEFPMIWGTVYQYHPSGYVFKPKSQVNILIAGHRSGKAQCESFLVNTTTQLYGEGLRDWSI